ncbi:neuroendocrine protein 7B2 [Episyrphus balteatus]|uniref:neuroendocrine protein 7B2 n=1 Tax=Episyrphus balteatus TaxID=286459 RepID=UPI002485CEF8|nr:neuroendocrine protein 7B2 [Episyrphus balteatus]
MITMACRTRFLLLTIMSLALPYNAFGFLPLSVKDHYFSDALLREIVDRMGKDLIDPTDTYIDPMADIPSHLALMARASDDLEAEQMDYDALLDGNPNPSLRDQEYLQHSSLWGHQFVTGGGDESPHRSKAHIKTDATLPAYCNPPNPCPYGYTDENGCISDFENTAAFSREYQTAQECMCDGEHMFDCPSEDTSEDTRPLASNLKTLLARQFHPSEHKNLVSKKFHPQEENLNPYLQGDKLPVAAKKGSNVY